MSLHQSPKIITDGLVFYTDIDNSKKSYLGRPTTNFITNGDFAGGLNAGTGGSGGDNPLNEIVRFVNPGNSEYCLRSTAVGGNAFTEYQMDLTTQLVANTTYVMSCWYYFSPDWNGTSAVFHSRAFSASGANIATGSDAGTTIETKVINGATWRRAYQTITTPSDYSNSFNWYLGYPSSNTTGYRYFTNVQMEQGTYPSPFVKGTRSSTTAINDLTQNNTITATSLTYANNASTSFSFNGPNYIDASVTPFSLYNLNVWLYNNYIIPGNDSAIGGIVTSYQSPINFNRQTTQGINLGGWTGSATNESVHIWSNSSTASGFNGMTHIRDQIPIGWHNFQFNWNGSTYDIWVDGIKRTTFAANFGHATLHPVNAIRIGGDVAQSYYFVGQIPSVSMYNKQLSDTEVLQNFNALKGRYGL
jgi:hypothetical protein